MRPVRSFALATLLAAPLCAVLPAPASAQTVSAVPQLMNFQGRLTKPDGTPVADGTYSVTFSLFDASSGGTQKWSQTLASLSVRNGAFAALLGGGGSPFPAGTFSGNLWLQIQVGSDAPLAPRQQLVTVAYAMKADSIKDGGVTSASLADGAVTSAKLAPGLLNGEFWRLGGNAGTTPASQFLGTTDNQPLVFRTNNAERLRLTPEGNLGLTLARYLAFTPTDTFAYDGKTTGHYALGWFNDTWNGFGNTAWLSGYGGIKLFSNGAPRLNITQAGNIGIGTVAPAAPLHLVDARTTGFPTIRADAASTVGTWLQLNNTSTGGRSWNLISTGSTNGEGAGKLLFNDQTSGGTRMTLDQNGNLGIGTISPGFPLSFPNTLGNKIALWGQTGNNFGFGIQNNLFQMYSATVGDDIAFGSGNSAAFTERVRLQNATGYVGIGISNPSARLHLNSTAAADSVSLWMDTAATFGSSLFLENSTTGGRRWELLSTGSGNVDGAGKFQVRDNIGGIVAMTVTANGRLGVGTANPQARLHVGPGGVTANGDANYFAFNFPSGAGTQDIFQLSNVVGFFEGELVATRAVASMNVTSFSDARAKNVLGRSNGLQDLLTLDRIQITDYKWIDEQEDAGRVQKKVIAQEVEKVLPSAVRRTRKVIPSVYAKATDVQYDTPSQRLTLTVGKPHGFVVGDKVNVFTERGDLIETPVLAVPSPKTFVVASEKGASGAFVYGKWVNDYRSVDYDAIAMLNVSATQELHRMLSARDAELREVKAANAELKARLEALEAAVSRLTGNSR